MNCLLLLTVVLSFGLIRGISGEFLPSTPVVLPAAANTADNRSGSEVGDSKAEMSRMMEMHLLRMLKLSARPSVSNVESLVPGYIRALQHAVDTAPLSTSAVNVDDADHLTWAVRALQGK